MHAQTFPRCSIGNSTGQNSKPRSLKSHCCLLSLILCSSYCFLRNTFSRSDPRALSLSQKFYRIWESTSLLYLVIFVICLCCTTITSDFQSSPKPQEPAPVWVAQFIPPDNFPGSARPALVLHLLPAPVRLQDSPWKLSWFFPLDGKFWNLSSRVHTLCHLSRNNKVFSIHVSPYTFASPEKQTKTKHTSLHPCPLGGHFHRPNQSAMPWREMHVSWPLGSRGWPVRSSLGDGGGGYRVSKKRGYWTSPYRVSVS